MKAKVDVTAYFQEKEVVGNVDSDVTYEKLKRGLVDWKPYIKKKLTMVKIPAEVFFRLMELDKQLDLENFNEYMESLKNGRFDASLGKGKLYKDCEFLGDVNSGETIVENDSNDFYSRRFNEVK